MKKIVFIANQYPPNVLGGAELSLQTLVRELRNWAVEPVVVSLSANSADSEDEVEGVRVYRVAVQNAYALGNREQSALTKLRWHVQDVHNAAMGKKVADILRKEAPDAVSTHNLQGFSVAVWTEVRKLDVQLIHTLHDYYLLCPKTTMFRDGRNCTRACLSCYALSVRKGAATAAVDTVIGVSRFVLDAHLKRGLFGNARSAVIHSARALSTAEAQHVVQDGHGGPLRIGYIGRVEREKGIEVLLRAVRQLGVDWTLQVAGKAPSPDYLAYLKSTYPDARTTYVGYVKAPDFYPALDILVVPSVWHEALGVVVYEAMGFGVPVIASRTGGIPEILAGGDTGWLFESGNYQELANLLATAASSRNRLDAMRPYCLARRKDFLPEIQAGKYLDAIGWRAPTGTSAERTSPR
jgi:glycosyltransferase involved in cell wall biosynthesis